MDINYCINQQALLPNALILGDCLDILQYVPDQSIDMILCDLPYGVTARNKWDVIIPLDKLWTHYTRIIKDNGAIVLTSTEPFTSLLINSNPDMFRYDLIWEKPLATGFLNANRMPLRSHENILIFYKKLPTYNPQKEAGKPYKMTRRSDTSNYNTVKNLHQETNNESGERYPKSVIKFASDKEKLHPTQKPLALFEYLIKTYTNPNDVVLDNCIGVGTTAIATINTNRGFIGIEKEEKYFNIAKTKIKKCLP